MEPSSALTPLQISEITKAFSICDTDGNGEIDATELANVMSHITGSEPMEEEVQRMLAAVDKDRSGTVSLAEFLEAVSEWLSDLTTNSKRFKSSSAEEEKKELHHQIKGFFSQFKKAEDYEAVRLKISEARDNENCMNTGKGWFGYREDGYSSQQKLEFLQNYHATVGGIDTIISGLSSLQSIDRITAVTSLETLLTITEIFSRPSERSAIADDLAQLFEALVRYNLPSILVNMLQTAGEPLSQVAAMRCLTLFVSGPRVPSTPTDSLMHPQQMFFKRMAIACDAPLVTARFLNTSFPSTCVEAVKFVTAMISFDSEVRDYYLENHILSLLCPLILDTTPINILRSAAQAIAILCGVTHAQLPQWDSIQPAFAPLGHMLYSDDEQLLSHVLGAMALVLPGVRPDFAIINRINELINAFPTAEVVHSALLVVAQIVRFDAMQTTSFLARSLLDSLKISLNSTESSVRSAALDVLEGLASIRHQFQPLVNAGVLELIANLLTHDYSLRVKIVSLLLILTQSAPLASAMAHSGFIPLLCSGLSWFKEYDSVIYEAYRVEGPVFNFELITNLVSSLENILMVGETEAIEKNQTLNPFTLLFDSSCIERFGEVLAGLTEAITSGAESWRRTRGGQELLEQRLFNLLNRIRVAYESVTSFVVNVMTRDHVLSLISKVITDYFPAQESSMDTQAQMASSIMFIKCYLPDDIRVFEVARDLSSDDITALVSAKYGRSMVVSYIDADGDPVRLESSSISLARSHAEASATASGMATPTLKLQLAEHSSKSMSVTPAPISPDSDDGMIADSVVSKKRSRSGAQLTLSTNSAHSQPSAFSGTITFPKTHNIDFVEGAALMKDEFAAMNLVQRNSNFAIIRNTISINEKDLESLFAQWTLNSPTGVIGRSQFEAGMRSIGINDPLVIMQNFNAFDVDKDGKIDFREFVVSLSTILKGSREERLRFMFRSYDMDNSGNLSPDEIFNIFRASMTINGTVANDIELMNTVNSVFQEIDLDDNGEISFDEFKTAVDTQKLPVALAFQVLG